MLLLTSTSDLVQVITDAAVTVDVHASWVDNASGTITPDRTNTAISTAATTTVVASPAASTQRNVQSLIISNRHASSAVNITVQHTDGATIARLYKVNLGANETMIYLDGVGWNCYTSTGGFKQATANSGNWVDLGGLELTGNAVTTGVLTIPAYDILRVSVRVTGYSGSDITSLRFNADAGANYWSRYISSAAGGVTLVNTASVSQALARLFALGTTLQRSAIVLITNNAATSKVGIVSGQTSTGAAGTSGVLEFGGFEWVNTSAQITSIEMRTAGGSVTMPAGTGFAVEGRQLP